MTAFAHASSALAVQTNVFEFAKSHILTQATKSGPKIFCLYYRAVLFFIISNFRNIDRYQFASKASWCGVPP